MFNQRNHIRDIMSQSLLAEWKKQQNLRDNVCNIVGHERQVKLGEKWYNCLECQRCGRDKMSKLTSANGDNWNISEAGSQVNFTYNGIMTVINKDDIDIITMILNQMK